MNKFDAGTFFAKIPWWVWAILIITIVASIIISPAFLALAIIGPLDEIIIIALVFLGGGVLVKKLHLEGFNWVVFIKLYIIIWAIFFIFLLFIGGWWISFIIALILSPIIYVTQYDKLDFLE